MNNKDVAKYLTEAKDLAAGKRWDAAWAALEKAERVPDLSPYDKDKIDEFKGYVLTQQHKYAEAGALFEQLAKSESASADERNDRLKKASQFYMRAKQYEKVGACGGSGSRETTERSGAPGACRSVQDTSPEIFAAQPPEPLSSWQLPSAKEVSRRKHRCKSS